MLWWRLNNSKEALCNLCQCSASLECQQKPPGRRMLQLNTALTLGSRASGLLRKISELADRVLTVSQMHVSRMFVGFHVLCQETDYCGEGQILARHLPTLVCQCKASGANCVNGSSDAAALADFVICNEIVFVYACERLRFARPASG